MPASLTQADAPVQRQQLRSGVEGQLSVPRRTGLRLEEVLDGRLGADGVRELVHNPMQHGLADLLAQCVPGREKLSSANCSVRSTSLAASSLRTTGCTSARRFGQSRSSGTRSRTPTAWPPPTCRTSGTPPSVAPFVRLTARTDSGQMGLLIAPIDPQMPGES